MKMKAQTKALVASLIIVALGLSAVSGVTYSWFSDSDDAEISVSTASFTVNQRFGAVGGSYADYVNVDPTEGTEGNISITNLAANAYIVIPVQITYSSTIPVLARTVVEITDSDMNVDDLDMIQINGQSISSIGTIIVLKDWTTYDKSENSEWFGVTISELIAL